MLGSACGCWNFWELEFLPAFGWSGAARNIPEQFIVQQIATIRLAVSLICVFDPAISGPGWLPESENTGIFLHADLSMFLILHNGSDSVRGFCLGQNQFVHATKPVLFEAC